VRLWEVNSGAEIRTIAGHLASLRGAAVSADGRFVATASVDDTAKIWNRFTGTLARSLEGHTGNVNTVQLNATGTLCVTGAEDQQAIVWDATTGTILRTFTTHTGAINAVALSTDGELAVTGSDDDTAKLWNVTTGAELHTYSEPGMTDVRAVAISPDRTKVLTGGQDNSVRLWDLYGVTSTWSSGSLGNDVRAVAFSPDGVLVAAAASTDVTVWRVATGAVVHTLSGHSSNVVSVMFSPDGDHLLTGGFDDRAVVWNLDTGTQAFAAHPLADVYSAVYTPEGKQMVLALGAERAELWEIPLQSYTEHAGAITALDFLPSGAQFVSGSTDDTAKLWNTEEATVARTYDEHTSDVLSLDVAPDGSTVATGSMDRDAIVRQTATGVLVQTYDDHNERVQAIAFNPVNAGIVATGSWDNSVRTWDVATTTVAFDLDLGRNPLGLAFSPNGTHLAIACQSAVPTANAVIYDVATQALTGTLAGHSARVNCIAWSPDGRFLCTGSSDDQFIAAIWDAQTGNLLHALVGHDAAVNAVAFSPDSSLVATGSNDNLAKLWDVVTGSDLRTFRGHGNENVTAVAFSPGGKQVLTGGTGGVIRLWRISISDLRVTQPDTALTWEEGTVQEVTWETGDIQANVDLTYSLDQGVTWQPIVLNTPNDGSELWTLPLVDADVNTCLVSVQSTTSAADYDASDALFTIQDTGGAPPTKAIPVVIPNGGEVWAELSTHYILWETQGDVGQVSVHLSVNGGQTWTPVDPLVTSANDGKNWYAWDIPDLAEDKPECLIRIQNVTGENVADESDAVFTISTGAPPDATPHDADYDGNWIIEPHEVTRVIELYKAGHYHRDNSPQPHADGFAPGEAP
jgi:WD40 repeat protein